MNIYSSELFYSPNLCKTEVSAADCFLELKCSSLFHQSAHCRPLLPVFDEHDGISQ